MDRIVDTAEKPEDGWDAGRLENLRPKSLAEFVGQGAIKGNLGVFIKSAKGRGTAMDHCLLYGPPGLGKTTLAGIIANELGVGFKATSAPMFSKVGDLAAIFTSLQPNDVLFIDEVHRLGPALEEVLYSVMEDFKLDILIGEGPAARTVKIDVAPFTLIGATTRTGLLSTPLRERFGIPLAFEFYEDEDLAKIVARSAGILGIRVSQDGALEIAKRSRGTPRIANRLLRRVRDFAVVDGRESIDADEAKAALAKLSVDDSGLDALDRRYLSLIIENYNGGPVGIETLSALLSEEPDTIEDVIEPYMLQIGFLQRTPRGRVITAKGYRHLGLETLVGKKDNMLV
ncbi:MAG: Holliday junction branch migration DNA helicase RuvB [Rickettsiales bacterium]|jgi:Holliday junction DNA helicase RuvB|nr:Holliday junction branch migration DNA helicase RuvB [Rickettsiales bacterium]